jgi:hypothetical protein
MPQGSEPADDEDDPDNSAIRECERKHRSTEGGHDAQEAGPLGRLAPHQLDILPTLLRPSNGDVVRVLQNRPSYIAQKARKCMSPFAIIGILA